MDTSGHEGARDRLLGGVLRSGLSRRGLLRVGVVAASATTLAPLLAACGGGSDKATATKPAATSAAASPTTGTTGAASPTTGSSGAASPTAGSASPTSGSSGAAPTATTVTLPPTATKGVVVEGKGGKIVAVRQNDSDSLDPQRTILGDSYNVFRNIFDPLVTIAPSLEFEPVIAEKYSISDDGLTYAFTIRKGMKFHDGSDVTAADVKYTFDRATNPDAPSQAVSFIDAFDHADLIDADNVNLVLKTANAPFLSNVAVEYFGILPQAATDAAGDDFGTNPVGSGPWKFKEWIQGEQATLEANADYTQVRSFVNGKGGPAADQLIFRAIPENQTQIAAFQTGEVNVMILLPNTEYKNFKDDPDYQVFVDPGSTEISAIEFATLPPAGDPGDAVYKPPFDDLKLRQAVAYGIDADEIIDKIYFGLAQRAYGPMPTGLFAFDPDIEQFGYHFDPTRPTACLRKQVGRWVPTTCAPRTATSWSWPSGTGPMTPSARPCRSSRTSWARSASSST